MGGGLSVKSVCWALPDAAFYKYTYHFSPQSETTLNKRMYIECVLCAAFYDSAHASYRTNSLYTIEIICKMVKGSEEGRG